MMAFVYLIFFIFGAVLGSFYNVLIYRLPRGENFIFPRSHCTNCQKLIPWYENLPIFSFLVLKGRCSGCHSAISWRYPFVETLVGISALLLGLDFNFSLEWLLLYLFQLSVLSILVIHFFIDLDHKILPDSLNVILGVLFLAYALIHYSWPFWLSGLAVGAGFPLLVTWGFYLLRGQIGLGGGDVKLYGVLGLYLGPLGIIHTIFLSCFIGALFGGGAVLLKKMDKNNPIAFGPFIILVALIQIFFPSFFASYLIFV